MSVLQDRKIYLPSKENSAPRTGSAHYASSSPLLSPPAKVTQDWAFRQRSSRGYRSKAERGTGMVVSSPREDLVAFLSLCKARKVTRHWTSSGHLSGCCLSRRGRHDDEAITNYTKLAMCLVERSRSRGSSFESAASV